jgi:protein-L-isoaspartate(D-aspartate) O-methyltransferase
MGLNYILSNLFYSENKVDDMEYIKDRKKMVEILIKGNIIKSPEIEAAMLKVPRHRFISGKNHAHAYSDSPQLIGEGQTISAPHMNAMMCEALDLKKGQRILEIGTGSGYHAALLAEIVGPGGRVITIERHGQLAKKSKNILGELGYTNIEVVEGDGTMGYPEKAPYDRILVTAAGPKIPDQLVDQLSADNGIMCIPVGQKQWSQNLIVLKKQRDSISKDSICKVVFVPLIGEDGFAD